LRVGYKDETSSCLAHQGKPLVQSGFTLIELRVYPEYYFIDSYINYGIFDYNGYLIQN